MQVYPYLGCSARAAPKKSFEHQPQMESIPLSFGANFHDDPICRSSLRKSHALHLPPPIVDDDAPHASYNFTGGFDRLRDEAPPDVAVKAPPPAPILRFLGYSREKVPESPDEEVRIRKIAALYYTEDGTVLLREASQINSGMIQGEVLKRQKVPKPGNPDVFFGPEDFMIGNSVQLYATKLHFIDMDAATKKYFAENLHIDVPESLPWPEEEDTYNARIAQRMLRKAKKEIPTSDMDHRRAAESASGGAISKHAPDDIRTAQQFFKNSINQHLQFAALWDDRNKISGDLRRVVIKYYLENDSIEIVEKRDENCGREGGLKLLSRQRIQSPEQRQDPSWQQNTFGLLLKRGFRTFEDFSLGIEMDIFGHNYLIYDADAFTREWYKKKCNRDLGPAMDVNDILTRDAPVPVKRCPPEHNGFGSEEDSFQNWKHLLLKPLRTDTQKLIREAGKVMLFRACFHGTIAPEDEGREFLIMFHRDTDEIEITERQFRNTGIVGGKFLAKMRHKKTLPDGRMVYFTPADFVVGETITIGGRKFKLLQIDERSRRQIEGIEDPITQDRICELVVQLKSLLLSKFLRLHEGYRQVAPEGILSATEIRQFFERCSNMISLQEAACLVEYFAPGKNGIISFNEFVSVMDIPNSTRLDELANAPSAVRKLDIEATQTKAPELLQTAVNVAEKTKKNRLKKMFVDKIAVRRGTIQEVFRLMSSGSANSKLSRKAYIHSLSELFHITVPQNEKEMLATMVFGDKDEITFKEFHLFIDDA